MDFRRESEMFNLAADYYDRYRPSYPGEIIDALVSRTGVQSGSRLLEIGSGSGKATELFSGKGLNILCIDPGRDLVDIGNKRFPQEHFTFIAGRFEETDFPANHFDVVYSAQAFHWIPQPIGYEKCSQLLKAEGYLALFWNMYVARDTPADRELLALSARHGGFADFLSEDGCEHRIRSISAAIENSGLFTSPEIIRHPWTQTYTADDYCGFVMTGNKFLQKSEEEQQAAFEEIRKLADRNRGVIERPYLCVLYLARKR